MPLSTASTSWAALSPSRVKSRSPAATCSPSSFSQATHRPSSILQPRRGTVIAVAIAYSIFCRVFCAFWGLFFQQVAHGASDGGRAGDDGRLQRRAVRRRREGAVEAPHRGVEVVEAAVGGEGCDL